MKTTRARWLAAMVAGVAAFGVVVLALAGRPAWAAPAVDAEPPLSPAQEAMHEACHADDADAMAESMDALTDEDWQSMTDHMDSDHHGAMSGHAAGMGSMMRRMGFLATDQGAQGA